jgi:hypothetical protein
MVYVVLALIVVTFALVIYWWLDKAARWRYLQAGYVTLGVGFGIQALNSYQRHLSRVLVALYAVCAVILAIGGTWNLWRGRRPEPQPAPEDPRL